MKTKTQTDRAIMAMLLDPMRMNRISAAAARVYDTSTSFEVHRIVAEAKEDLNAEYAAFTVLASEQSISITDASEPLVNDVSRTFCRYVSATEPFRVTDSKANPLVCDLGEALGIGSYLGVPVTFAGYILGALCVWGRQPREWTPDDTAVLTALAAQLTDWWKT